MDKPVRPRVKHGLPKIGLQTSERIPSTRSSVEIRDFPHLRITRLLELGKKPSPKRSSEKEGRPPSIGRHTGQEHFSQQTGKPYFGDISVGAEALPVHEFPWSLSRLSDDPTDVFPGFDRLIDHVSCGLPAANHRNRLDI